MFDSSRACCARACAKVCYGGAALALWWALWSLADAYLLEFTPWSELAAGGLAAGGLALAAVKGKRLL